MVSGKTPKDVDKDRAVRTIELALNDRLDRQFKWMNAKKQLLKEYQGKSKPTPMHVGNGMYADFEMEDPKSEYAIKRAEELAVEVKQAENRYHRTKNALAYIKGDSQYFE